MQSDPFRTRPAPAPAGASGHRGARPRATLPAIALALAGAPALAGAELVVRLSPGDAPDRIVFSLANDGDAPVSVLRTDTPLDAVLGRDAFDVYRPSKAWDAPAASYAGRLHKRTPPSAADFVTIAPGETLSNTIALGRHYDVPDAGEYTVRFDDTFHVRSGAAPPSARARGAASAEPIEVVPATASGADRVTVRLRPGALATRARPPAFNGCDAGRRDIIVEAIAAAELIAAESLQSLTELPVSERPAAPRYARWFGRYTAERYAAVTARFDAILGAITGETLGTDCTCDEDDLYAYVFANRPYDLYLCPVFFRTDTLGTDSRAGTIVHELSHFERLGGSDDHVYGQQSAAGLALDDPDRAVENADSLEYFAENTPALAMTGDGRPADDDPPASPRSPGDGGFADLPLNARTGGFLADGDEAVFRTDGADSISLTSMSGDADLYVFDDPGLRNPVCAANAFSADSTVDRCELPPGETWYVVVRGYTAAAEYEIVATALDVDGSAPGRGIADDDPIGGAAGDGGGGGGGGAAGGHWLALLVGAGAARLAHRRPPGARRTSPRTPERA